MSYTVVWKPEAERELTALWLASRLRHLVNAAVNDVDRQLANNPKGVGESREGNRRIALESPLAFEFEVVDEELTVFVIAVWEYPGGPHLRPL